VEVDRDLAAYALPDRRIVRTVVGGLPRPCRYAVRQHSSLGSHSTSACIGKGPHGPTPTQAAIMRWRRLFAGHRHMCDPVGVALTEAASRHRSRRVPVYLWYTEHCPSYSEVLQGCTGGTRVPSFCLAFLGKSLFRRCPEAQQARIAYLLGLHPSTVHRVLTRYGLARLPQAADSSDLVHVDIKKLGKIPAAGGWRMLGR
jgi:hypothetical protein